MPFIRIASWVVGGAIAVVLVVWQAAPWFWYSAYRVKLSGRVLADGRPVPNFWLEFSADASRSGAVAVQTDREGAYSIGLPRPGQYLVTFLAARRLPVGMNTTTFEEGEQEVDFRIADTEVTLVNPAGNSKAWQVTFYEVSGPTASGADLAGILSPGDFGAPLVGLPVGKWRLFLDAPPSVASEGTDVDLRHQRQLSVEVQPNDRGSVLEIMAAGMPVPNPTVLANTRKLVGSAEGTVRLDRVGAGMPLLVLRDGFVPQCVLAPPRGGARQVTLESSPTSELEIALGPETNWPFGFFQSQQDECAIPAKWFRTADLRKVTEGIAVKVAGLHYGRNLYWPAREVLPTVILPGQRIVQVHAPLGCSQCNREYAEVMIRR